MNVASNSQCFEFLSSICQYCFDIEKEVKRCGSCKVMPYCSREHQKLARPKHKALCNAIKTSNERIPYEVKNFQEFNDYKVMLQMAWQSTLQRPLDPYECTVALHARACEVCYERRPIFDCKNCRCVAYCCAEHYNLDSKRHTRHCGELKLALLNARPLSYEKNYEIALSDQIPGNTEEFVGSNDCVMGHLLSPCGTIIYLLQKIKLQKENLVFHFVGASNEENKLNWEFFGKVLLKYFTMSSIEFILVGPELNIIPIIQRNNIKIERHTNLYHEISSSLPEPDAIFALNCGIHENLGSTSDTWKATIPYLLRKKTPLVLTGYTEGEVVRDKTLVLESCGELKILVDCEKNPFRSLRPFRNWNAQCTSVFYPNGYIFICEKT